MSSPTQPARGTAPRGPINTVLGATQQLRKHVLAIQDISRNFARLVRPVGHFADAILRVVARIWLSQTVLIHGIMAMMQVSPVREVPATWDTALHTIVPLLLTAGLSTRPLALVLLIRMASGIADVDINWPQAVLLLWFVARGAGPLSIDCLMRGGLARVPIWGVRAVSRLYAWSDHALEPALLFGVRAYLAATVLWVAFGSVAPWQELMRGDAFGLWRSPWWLLVVTAMLGAGLATRVAALVLCGAVPLPLFVMSSDNRFGFMLLLLLLAASGAGELSLDFVLAQSSRARQRLGASRICPTTTRRRHWWWLWRHRGRS